MLGSNLSTHPQPLRAWPGVVIVVVQWFLWYGLIRIAPNELIVSALGGLGAGLFVLVWWLFFSRAGWLDRIGAVVLAVGAVFLSGFLVHESLGSGLTGQMFYMYAIPSMSLALVAGAVVGQRLSAAGRRVAIVLAIFVASGFWLNVRVEGLGVGRMHARWRWSATPEERLLASAPALPAASTASPAEPVLPRPVEPGTAGVSPGAPGASVAASPVPEVVEWPGFRGPLRDGIVRGVRIATDWTTSPPVQLWRRSIGPGWSSFAVAGDRLYTQEQRGDEEIVACYRVSTGAPVWTHRDRTRFWEAAAGPGPRATPALAAGRLYALGATGRLNVLDAATGAVRWSRDVASDLDASLPEWGFSGSPLIVDDLVVVAVGTLAAYETATGKRRWIGPTDPGNYSSPHLLTLGGVRQIVMHSAPGTVGVAPADGTVLWEHASEGGAIVQPARTAEGDVIVAATAGPGGLDVRRIAVSRAPSGWTVTERWTSTGLKPYYNDFVVHNGHAYGFDGSILASIDLADGTRKWKGGRYGNGQLILLAEQNLLLVLSEDGEVALVSATPDKYTELARIPAIEGTTWNHPAMVGHVLLVRNGEAMAAFRLAPEKR